MKESYEKHKGEQTAEGIICGYNEQKKCLIVESDLGWTRLHPYDEIFSSKKQFLYIPKP